MTHKKKRINFQNPMNKQAEIQAQDNNFIKQK